MIDFANRGIRDEPVAFCTCPHAAGRQVVCKHMVATFFTAFPEEAQWYYDEIQKSEEEREDYQEELYDKCIKYVRSLKRDAENGLPSLYFCLPAMYYLRQPV